MMNFGGVGANLSSSSSSSNLSPLAPPFTVDRLNPKPNSNHNLNYADVEPFSHGWQYASPSAPVPELVFESSGINSGPLFDDYRFSPPSSVGPTISTHWSNFSVVDKASDGGFSYGGGEVKPYYSPYGTTSLVGDDNVVAERVSGPRVKSRSNLFDADYEPRWVDNNVGFDDGKRTKRVELDGSFFEKANLGGSHGYENQLNHGGFAIDKNKKISSEDAGVSYQKLNPVSNPEVHIGSSGAQMEDKLCQEQNFPFFPYDSSKPRTSAYISSYPESYYHPVPSSDMHKNFSNDQNVYENSFQRIDTPFLSPVSALRSSPTVVIRPPPVPSGNIGQRTFSRKPARVDNFESMPNVDFGSKFSSLIKEGSFETNIFNTPKDSFDNKIKVKFGAQSPDVNILGGFKFQAVNSSENSSDFMDHHSTSVDSPCWKGASSSQFSLFDIEAGCSNHVKKNMDEYYGLDCEDLQNLHPVIDCSRASSVKADESNKNIENECDAISSSKEHSLLGDDPKMPIKESVLLNDGVKMTLNDVSEGGDVAVQAAEKVLDSPASREDVTERTMLTDRKLNVPTVLKAMHNLSELLLFHVSSDGLSLEEENAEILKNIISNLDSCLNNKIVEASKNPEPNIPLGETSDKLQESDDVSTILGSPHTTNEASDSHNKLDRQHTHEEEKSSSFSGKKDEKPPLFSPMGDDLDITKDDDMTKAIKKVLEENFHVNDETTSQALLFKNLWLDAEAKLCSMSYKARFDRMKIQMEQIKIGAPQDNEDTEEMMSEVSVSPNRIAVSELGPKEHDSPISKKPALQKVSISSPIGPADGIDASVMARFDILKSREENVTKPINREEEQKSKTVDGEHEGGSNRIMDRLNILMSRAEAGKFPITLMRMDEEKQSEEYVGPCISSQSETETLNTSSLNEDDFGSYVRGGAGYETLDEFHLSISNDPIVHLLKNSRIVNQNDLGRRDGSSSFKNSRVINQNDLGRRDSSSSDWEHVLKDDFSWKNL